MTNPSIVLFRFLVAMTAASTVSLSAPPAGRKIPGFQPVEEKFLADLVEVPDVPGLPRVLLIGDSISIGYTRPVRALLAGRANVHRPGENCGDTAYGRERLDDWLGQKPWAVIHFNFGLHDIKYLDAQGNYVSPDQGKQVASPETYAKNLRELVARLKRTGAHLIFATITPVPAGTKGRTEDGEQPYNAVARQIMKDAGIAINDLNTFIRSGPDGLQLPHNVHFSPEGSSELAKVVAARIETALTKKSGGKR